MAKIIGIDLGTSNSAASVLEGGKPKIIPSAEGASAYGKAFPSVVAFTKDNQLLVGEPARRQAVSNTEGTVQAAKRKMGTKHVYKVNGKEYSPQQISAFILQKIKRDAEAFLGDKVEKAVITVPAYFNDDQRQATKDAGEIAGLEVVRIVNEPTAACMSYGLDKAHEEHKILVFDLGGGTLDVTIMEFGDGVFEVKSTSGDTQLGGTDMDNAIVEFLAAEFKKNENIDVTKDKVAMQRLREAGERAKIELSNVFETEINLPFISAGADGPKHFVYKMTRAKLEELVDPLIKRCLHPVEQAMADAKLSAKDIDKIIMVGGPTRMPIVRKFVEGIVGKKVETGVDPMECVAMGAAVQGGVLAGDIKDVLLLDVTPLTLGIETLGGITTALIQRNTTIPTKKSQIFSTAADHQPAVTINVIQGERPMAKDNKSIGRFDLDGIPPAPRGIPQIEVTFDIDANGIVNVSAKDLGTGKKQHITISGTTRLDKDEIEKMRKEAEQFAEDDKKIKEKVETLNEAEAMVTQYEHTLKEMGDKVDQKELAEVQKEIDEMKNLLKDRDNNYEAIKKKQVEMTDKFQKIATEMYQKAAAAQAEAEKKSGAKPGDAKASKGKSSKKSGDGVVDAEVVDEDNSEAK